jgi:zinc transporter ZupT
LTVIVAAVAGAIGALVALAFGAPPVGLILAAVAAFMIVIVLTGVWGRRSFTRGAPDLEPRFPSPTD